MKKVFWGLFFIVSSILVTLDQFGFYGEHINIFILLFTIILVMGLFKSIYKGSFPGILFSLAFLCIIYKKQLDVEYISTTSILTTALLASIGLSILFDKHAFFKKHTLKKHRHYTEIINGDDKEEVDFNVQFGSSIKYVNSEDFKVANLRSNFGGMQVYFDNAKITGDKATINLDVSFSGVELYVPKEWRIISKVDVTLGAVDFKNQINSKADKTVTLNGKVTLGGVEIFYI